jgi:putative zinc finger protein
MTEPEEKLGSDVHPAATLLPWYLNGTLREEERQEVAQHLRECQPCRTELDDLSRLRQQVKAAYADLPGVSPQVFRSVMATIRQERRVQPERQRVFRWERAQSSSWLDTLDHWLRPMFGLRWVPVLASTLIIGQLALLLWVVGQEPVIAPHEIPSSTDGVVSRGIPTATARYRVAFQETAPEGKIRRVIHNIGGRIVDGPSADGFYTIEVPVSDQALLEKQLESLQRQADLIRSAERLKP